MLVPVREFDSAIDFPHTKVALLGSTGSIGCSALELIRNNTDKFSLFLLAAGSNVDLLAGQVAEFRPRYASIANPGLLAELKSKLQQLGVTETKCVAGEAALVELAGAAEIDTVLAAIVGMSGLRPVLAALQAGKRVALANKESLVVAGELVSRLVTSVPGAELIPVDSEHSALFQAMQGERVRDISQLTLTASGGPFFKTPLEELAGITPEIAVKHPRWSMGPKISVDSATLMNKALELIEAHWLFGFPAEKLGVLVHPQSIIHSIVELVDGSQVAQLSIPDMKGPILYSLTYPHGRLPAAMPALNLREVERLEFYELDQQKFPAPALALECIRNGGSASAVFNIANEIAVARFLNGAEQFTGIVPFVQKMLERFSGSNCENVEQLFELEAQIKLCS